MAAKEDTPPPSIDVLERFDRLAEPDDRPEVARLLANIHRHQDRLDRLAHASDEEAVYRYYHQSFKVFSLNQATELMAKELIAINPHETPIWNLWFDELLHDALTRRFDDGTNENWMAETRPVLEAFFHARYFVQQAAKYGHELEDPPRLLPCGWAALLELYLLR